MRGARVARGGSGGGSAQSRSPRAMSVHVRFGEGERPGYSFPNGPNLVGWHGHSTKKPDPKTAQHGLPRARAKHAPAPCPCLGRDASTVTRPGHGPLKRPARGRHYISRAPRPPLPH